ncbi:Lipoprotein signal peptidase [Candidatus Bealeia paramacronuclearis]|uniref:Lipoprotein signal peptidase n=1 Tax=Candidatus Bealeia paramacronuclearis TaxID=1921001 RepID=A0ABZ2C289_9PROT|nr:Lipoprotein signal peptidase [Candidatus Bealeia paramacronuclearis]
MINVLLNRIPILAFIIAGIVMILDQATKWWMITDIMNPPFVLKITSYFNIVLALNRGVSFSLFQAGSPEGVWFLIGLTSLIVTGILVWLFKTREKFLYISLGLVMGGAIGNIIDRFRYGAVVDFLDFHWEALHWPAFNVADTAITIGVALIFLHSFKGEYRE